MTSSTCIGSGSVGSGFGVSSGCFVIVLVIVVVLVLEEETGSVSAPIVQSIQCLDLSAYRGGTAVFEHEDDDEDEYDFRLFTGLETC